MIVHLITSSAIKREVLGFISAFVLRDLPWLLLTNKQHYSEQLKTNYSHKSPITQPITTQTTLIITTLADKRYSSIMCSISNNFEDEKS